MTLIEAAALLGVTPDNLRGAIKRGSLKARKVGRDWWVDPKDVERYRKEHRREKARPTRDDIEAMLDYDDVAREEARA